MEEQKIETIICGIIFVLLLPLIAVHYIQRRIFCFNSPSGMDYRIKLAQELKKIKE